MKILTLSDLCWERNLKMIELKTVESFTINDLSKKKYQRIKKYFNIIKNENPELVLFAGDITGDGSCGHGYQNAFKILLKLLEITKISSFFIRGDHDEEDSFNEVLKFCEGLKFSKNISNKIESHKGITILGIPFEKTNNKAYLKELINIQKTKVDIVLSHSELKRRTWLFDLNCDFIITGHFDKKLTLIEDIVFISIDNDSISSISYCNIEYLINRTVRIKYFIENENEKLTYKEELKNIQENNSNKFYENNGKKKSILPKEKPEIFLTFMDRIHSTPNQLRHLRGANFKKAIERIRIIKTNNKLLSEKEFENLVKLIVHDDYLVSKTLIMDYTGINYKTPN
jgi:predicted phosphodiesterase